MMQNVWAHRITLHHEGTKDHEGHERLFMKDFVFSLFFLRDFVRRDGAPQGATVAERLHG
jgi:hypothetical protein